MVRAKKLAHSNKFKHAELCKKVVVKTPKQLLNQFLQTKQNNVNHKSKIEIMLTIKVYCGVEEFRMLFVIAQLN